MKAIKLMISLLVAGTILATASPEGDPKTETKNTSVVKKRTVLVVGIKKGNITSNFYSTESIAEKTAITRDSLEDVFSRKIIESIHGKNDSRINVVSVMHKPKNKILNKVNYYYNNDILVSDLSELSDDDFQMLLKQYEADYVMFIGNYYLKYEGGSNLFHIIKYDVYNKNKKNILSEKAYFNTPELMPLASFEKKFERSGSKIMEQIEKVSE